MGVRSSKFSTRAASFRKGGAASSLVGRVVSFRKGGATSSFVTPRGYVPVAVGVDDETKRFMIHTTALTNAEFSKFLWRSAEEYGFCNEGILRIPYDAKAFEEWMSRNNNKQRAFRIQPSNAS